MPKTKAPPAGSNSRSRRAAGEVRPATAWIDVSLWRALKHYAIEHDTSLSAMLSDLVRDHLSPLVNRGRHS